MRMKLKAILSNKSAVVTGVFAVVVLVSVAGTMTVLSINHSRQDAAQKPSPISKLTDKPDKVANGSTAPVVPTPDTTSPQAPQKSQPTAAPSHQNIPAAPKPAPNNNPFEIGKVISFADIFCNAPQTPVIRMGNVSLYIYYPPKVPTQVNWQIELLQYGAVSVVQTGSYIAQPGDFTHDINNDSTQMMNIKGDINAMRFHVTSPNDIVSPWTYVGQQDTTCN